MLAVALPYASQGMGDSLRFPLLTSGTVWLALCLLSAAMICIPAVGDAQDTETSSHTVPSKPQSHKKPDVRSSEGIAVAAAGDIIAAEPFAHVKDSSIRSAMSVIAKSDVGFGNLEEALIDFQKFRGYPDSENGGMWLIGELQVAADLRAVGFRMLARANNHSTEWGREGMRETDRVLDRAGIVHAGTGENRALARAAAFLTTPN